MKLKIGILSIVAMLILFSFPILTIASSTSSNSAQKLNVAFEVIGSNEGVRNAGLIQAKFSVYDKNKNYLGSQSLSNTNFEIETERYYFVLDVPIKENDKFYIKLDSISDYLGTPLTAEFGNMSLGKYNELNISSFWADPGSGGGMQLSGDSKNPIRITADFKTVPGELLVATTVNGKPIKGVAFEYYDAIGTKMDFITDSNGLIRERILRQGSYSLILKPGQEGFYDANTPYNFSTDTGCLTIQLKNKNSNYGESISNSNTSKVTGYANFIKVNSYNNQTFSDFLNSEWFATYIEFAYEKGIISGKGNGSFDPYGNLTVAEAITLAGKVNKIYNGFSPVFNSNGPQWYSDAVKYAVNNGLITNAEFDGKYNDKATRSQMVYIFSKALPTVAFNSINEPFKIPDVIDNSQYKDQIQMFYDSGIIGGSDLKGTFNPSAYVTRAEAATIICKVANPLERKIRSENDKIQIVEDVDNAPVEENVGEEVLVDKNVYYAHVTVDGKAYYIDKNGNFMTGNHFDQIYGNNFTNGVAIVYSNHKYGYITSDGNYLYEPQFDSCEPFSEDMAVVRKNSLYGYVSKDTQNLIIPQFDSAREFQEGLAAVLLNSKWGYIDKTGNLVIAPQFQVAYDFSEGLAAVAINGEIGYIDTKGNFVIKPQFSYASEFVDGGAVVSILDKHGIIDKTGKYVFGPKYNYNIPIISEGLIAFLNDDTTFDYIDVNGKYVTNQKFDKVENFVNGFAYVGWYVQINQNYSTIQGGWINREGNLVFDSKLGNLIDFEVGLFSYSSNGLVGIRNKDGKIIVTPQYNEILPYSNGLAAVKKGSKWGYIDETGKIIIDFKFDFPGEFMHIE